jgi:hypothetical protein
MFKTLVQSTCAIAVGLWCAGVVQAVPITFEDTVSGPVYMNGKTGPTSYAFEHDITDNGFIAPGVITAAKITIIFDEDYTDPSGQDHKEYVKVTIGVTDYGSWEIDHNDDFVLTLMPDALAALSSTGEIGVVATMTNLGDIRFMEAELLAEGFGDTRPQQPHATPEPSTLILLGSGLAGVATIGLRRRQQEDQA